MSKEAIGRAELNDIGRVNALKPTREQFKGRKGYWEKPKKNGGFEWGYDFKPNDGQGKLTKEAAEVGEMMRPSMKADLERAADLNGWPGEYGKGLKGRVTLLARHVAGDWCGTCDRLRYWCECAPGLQGGSGALRAEAGGLREGRRRSSGQGTTRRRRDHRA